MPKQMTFEEFKEYFEKNFYEWVSKSDRPLTSFLCSLEDWAKVRYNKAYKDEYGQEEVKPK